MAHLTGFGLENFRVFKDYTWFDFAPITILVGPNNSGKSSLIKALLLLQDNFKKGNLPPFFEQVGEGFSRSFDAGEADYEDYNEVFEPSTLEFDGKVHGLSSPISTINRNSGGDILQFTFSYKIESGRKELNNVKEYSFEEIKDLFERTQSLDDLMPSSRSAKRKLLSLLISNAGIEKMKELMGGESLKSSRIEYQVIHTTIKYRLSFLVPSVGESTTVNEIELLTEKEDCFLKITAHEVFFDPDLYEALFLDPGMKIKNLLSSHDLLIIKGHGVTLRTWLISNGLTQDKSKDLSERIFRSLYLYEKDGVITPYKIKSILEGADYLVTSKNEQERVYLDSKDSISQKQLKDFIGAERKGFNTKKFLEKSAKLFNIEGNISVDYDIEKSTIFPNIDGQSFLNFGYGYNQIAFLLFKIAANTHKKFFITNFGSWEFDTVNTNLIIIEEPETNLHPKLQSRLADLLNDASDSFNTQFIIETHSEYMIRKFQYLVATGEMKPEDIVIYYFHDPNDIPVGENQVKKITILEDGSLSDDFGPGFFDEAATWELELLKLKKNKARQN